MGLRVDTPGSTGGAGSMALNMKIVFKDFPRVFRNGSPMGTNRNNHTRKSSISWIFKKSWSLFHCMFCIFMVRCLFYKIIYKYGISDIRYNIIVRFFQKQNILNCWSFNITNFVGFVFIKVSMRVIIYDFWHSKNKTWINTYLLIKIGA